MAEKLVSLIRVTIATALWLLVGELAANRQANERQVQRVAAQASLDASTA